MPRRAHYSLTGTKNATRLAFALLEHGDSALVKTKRPWSLLSSHGLVLVTVARYGDLAVPEICHKTGLSRSTVLHALKDLRRARMLNVRRVGRRNTYCIEAAAPLRHPVARDTELGDMLKAFRHVR